MQIIIVSHSVYCKLQTAGGTGKWLQSVARTADTDGSARQSNAITQGNIFEFYSHLVLFDLTCLFVLNQPT